MQERDLIIKAVVPKLRKLCFERDVQVFAAAHTLPCLARPLPKRFAHTLARRGLPPRGARARSWLRRAVIVSGGAGEVAGAAGSCDDLRS